MNIPVLGQQCQFIKKKDSASFLFFINKLKDFCCMFSGHPPTLVYDLTCLKPALPIAESANAGEQCGV
jgi:hypothetical protein